MIQVPKPLQSSDGTGRVSRTITGIAGLVIMGGVTFTPLSEGELTSVVNQLLLAASAFYTLYGLIVKLRNKYYR